MLYVQQSLSEDEELVHIGNFHWMYTLSAIMSIFWGFFLALIIIIAAIYIQPNLGRPFSGTGFFTVIREVHPGVKLFAFLMIVLGLLRFAQMMIIKTTTEIAVTSSRLVFKRGLVARQVGEMAVDSIEGVNVLQSVLGRLLGYGRVAIRGVGVGEVVLPPLEEPIKFRRAIETAKKVNAKKKK